MIRKDRRLRWIREIQKQKENANKKKTGMAALFYDIGEFKVKCNEENNKGHYVNAAVYEGNIFIFICPPNIYKNQSFI